MRTLIFTDVNSTVSAQLIRATLRLARIRGDIEICGIVTSRPERFHSDRLRGAQRFARRVLVAATNRGVPFRTIVPGRIDLARLEREQGIPLLVPPGGDPNDARFIASLARDLKPVVALSYDCLSIFRKRLLGMFEQAVNFHAGLLPHYRGVMATSFSVLAGETESGFTFHRMTGQVDLGPILVQGAVPIAGATAEDVGRRKLALAVAALPRVLDAVVSKDPGFPPPNIGNPFCARDWLALIHVAHPEYTTEAQLRRRIRAFGIVHLTIEGAEYPVTRLRAATPGQPLAFQTADRRLLTPDRFDGLPRSLRPFVVRWLGG